MQKKTAAEKQRIFSLVLKNKPYVCGANCKARENRTVEYVLKRGKYNTSQLFSMPWNQL